ncbi:hypothetical protein GEV33_007831 [Tenebrio molitor]|uniref:Uncharacterized protein n=1 Tax=Tenebrio molitor TaxID=7067 RepID=A0A8J6HA57_TENMO|nr:hypothetical protein GEV33_007831 [Tenebrio molitor]
MTRGSNHRRRLQSATFRFGMHGPPAVSTEENRPGQRVSLQPTSIRYCAPSVRESRGYLPTVYQARMICYIWLPPPAVSTRRAQSTAEPCHEPKMPHPDIRCSGIIPWLPKPAITQLPTHLVTVSPASTSLIHCTTRGSRTIHLPSLSYSYLGQPVGSSCQSHTVPVSPVGLVKITPESRTFQNIIYEPHVWVEEHQPLPHESEARGPSKTKLESAADLVIPAKNHGWVLRIRASVTDLLSDPRSDTGGSAQVRGVATLQASSRIAHRLCLSSRHLNLQCSSVAAWLSEKVLRGRGPDASGFKSHRRGRIFSKEGNSARPWMKNQHSFGHHREVSTGSSPVGKGAHGCINVVVYVCECEVEWAWVAGESAPEPRRIT